MSFIANSNALCTYIVSAQMCYVTIGDRYVISLIEMYCVIANSMQLQFFAIVSNVIHFSMFDCIENAHSFKRIDWIEP